jgi:hypothetical protein
MDTIFTLRGLVREDTEISNEMACGEINTAALPLNVPKHRSEQVLHRQGKAC